MQLLPSPELIVWIVQMRSRLWPWPRETGGRLSDEASGENQFVEIEFKQ